MVQFYLSPMTFSSLTWAPTVSDTLVPTQGAELSPASKSAAAASPSPTHVCREDV